MAFTIDAETAETIKVISAIILAGVGIQAFYRLARSKTVFLKVQRSGARITVANHSEMPVYVHLCGPVGLLCGLPFSRLKRLDAEGDKVESGAVAAWDLPIGQKPMPPGTVESLHAYAITGGGRLFTSHSFFDPRRYLCQIRFHLPPLDRWLGGKKSS